MLKSKCVGKKSRPFCDFGIDNFQGENILSKMYKLYFLKIKDFTSNDKVKKCAYEQHAEKMTTHASI
jgi:hypothetical protein